MKSKKLITGKDKNLVSRFARDKNRKQARALQEKRLRRASRTRRKIHGTSAKPRLSVFRSNRSIYAQLIDDNAGHTLAVARGSLKNALEVGGSLAKKALDSSIKTVVFDKGRYAYHGRVKELADGARKGGLIF